MGVLEGLRSLRRKWRAADAARLQLDELLVTADPKAPATAQHEWLIELGYWLRRRAHVPPEPSLADRIPSDASQGAAFASSDLASPGARANALPASSLISSALSRASGSGALPSASLRLRYLVGVLERNPTAHTQVAATFESILARLDSVSLLCDTGLSQSASFWGELRERLAARTIPATPHTAEWSELLTLLFPRPDDAAWVAAIDQPTWLRACALLGGANRMSTDPAAADAPPNAASSGHRLMKGRHDVAASLSVLVGQVAASALTSSLRSRMGVADLTDLPFLSLQRAADALFQSEEPPNLTDPESLQRLNIFRGYLEASRLAALRVFEHLDENGVSVDIEFRVEAILARISRIELLLEYWIDPDAASHGQRLVSELLIAHQHSRSVGALFRQSFARLARKVVDRSAETGEHYITRDRQEYRAMFNAALGGGIITVLTVYLKFAVTSAHLHRFFEGIAASLNYAGCFVLIHFLGFTLATKQPAMTAPALAAKLDGLHKPDGLDAFVEETVSLMRSQAAAVLGNVIAVVPIAFLIQWGAHELFGANLISVEKAQSTVRSFSLWGPTPLFAAFTGVLLFASALIAGWVDNWFVYRRIGDVIAYHRRIKWMLGDLRARRWAAFWRRHISGIAGNVSLGFLLGLGPVIAESFALPLEVRHVTLSSGSLAVAVGVLGPAVMASWGFWLAVAGIVAMAFLNVGVSFFFAFQLALRSRDLPRIERSQIHRAILKAIVAHPGHLLLAKTQAGALSSA
ncbi:MAG: site-specific recombinase [Burkholderiaceae bacterium]